MMTNATLGIDVAKKKLDVTLCFGNNEIRKKTFTNDTFGYEKLLEWTKKYNVVNIHACMEFTGVYDENIAEFLYKKGHIVSRVNAMTIKAFAKSMLTRTKTDKKDSLVIAQYCKLHNPRPWNPEPVHIQTLKDLSRLLEFLKENYLVFNNALEKFHKRESPAKKNLKSYVNEMEKQIKALEKQLKEHIHQYPDLNKNSELLQTIPGIGEITAHTLLAEIPDINLFKDARQLAAFAGLTPCQRQSGSSVNGKSRLSKIGSARLRKSLYMPAIVAKRYNPLISPFFDTLIKKGKCKMSALGASMRKLLHIIFGILKTQSHFNPSILEKKCA